MDENHVIVFGFGFTVNDRLIYFAYLFCYSTGREGSTKEAEDAGISAS